WSSQGNETERESSCGREKYVLPVHPYSRTCRTASGQLYGRRGEKGADACRGLFPGTGNGTGGTAAGLPHPGAAASVVQRGKAKTEQLAHWRKTHGPDSSFGKTAAKLSHHCRREWRGDRKVRGAGGLRGTGNAAVHRFRSVESVDPVRYLRKPDGICTGRQYY